MFYSEIIFRVIAIFLIGLLVVGIGAVIYISVMTDFPARDKCSVTEGVSRYDKRQNACQVLINGKWINKEDERFIYYPQ